MADHRREPTFEELRRGVPWWHLGRDGERLVVRLLSPFVAAVLGTLVLFLWWLIGRLFT